MSPMSPVRSVIDVAGCSAALFVVLTACATLSFGDHYFMDLVAAALLILLVRALFALQLDLRSLERSRAVVSSLAMLAFWIAAIRFGATLPPRIVIALTGVTLGASALLERALVRAEARAEERVAMRDEAPEVAADGREAAPIVA